ncbi:bifunctional glycosyltransferase family 2 protein/CDP-glycerol:glycerophosphate glycerophosphotransferase [Streptomyces sp. NPDC046977]|uniref:bifunctional glycosyltransferase/CDP-glycerol:glycerophosphate glycerophosphotransferase n=1 Tax=Streptomyces sp. NPDC046977 TaxID=3154703 RepID=UPI0033D809A2
MLPRLSVVVPIYNVETYLEECLDSLAGQTLRELEVIMVDDGSTDSSAGIARAYAAKDSRFRLVQQPNGGLGNARNNGVKNCTPGVDYLTFVDSDDIIPDYAYDLCVRTLDETGSDLLSGNVQLLRIAGTSQSPMHKRPMATTRLKTHITKDESLIYDRLAPNKVFRKDFWDEHEMAFPEGVLYEDIPLTIPAHFRARSVDILSTPIYYWRQREAGAGPSITQRRTEPNAVRDRVAAVDSVSRFLAAQSGPEYRTYKRWYDKSAIGSDIRIFINVLPQADQEFRELFMQVASDFLSRVDPKVVEQLPAIMRLKWHLIGENKLDELLDVLAFEKRGTGGSIPVARRFRRYAKYPFFKDAAVGVPDHVYRLKQELALRTKVESVGWDGEKIKIVGHSYVNNVGGLRRFTSFKVISLSNSKSKRRLILPARTVYSPGATAASRQNRYSYDWSGFEVSLDANRLKTGGRWEEGSWRLGIGVLGKGMLRRGGFAPGPFGSGANPPVRYVDADTRIVPRFVRKRLHLRVEKVTARVTAHEVTDGRLVLRGTVAGRFVEGTRLQIRHSKSPVEKEYALEPGAYTDGGTAFTVRIPVADIVGGRTRNALPSLNKRVPAETWRASVTVPGEQKSRQLVADDESATGLHPIQASSDGLARELALHRGATGHLLLSDRLLHPTVDTLSWEDGGTLVLEGPSPFLSGEVSVLLTHRAHHEVKRFAGTAADGRFTVRLTPASVTSLAGTLPIRSGRWNVMVEDPATAEALTPVVVTPELVERLPAMTERDGRRYTAVTHAYDELVLDVSSALKDDERGPYWQARLRNTTYAEARRAPLRDAVLYDSYTGKQFSDSPRAVYEELVRRGDALEHLWVVRDSQVALPDGAQAVRMYSRDWFEAMARCRYIVTNAHLPHWIKRREGQVIVQAWHGTPLKKIGHDIEDVQFANGRYLENVAQESLSWSFLVSPNRFSTPILKRAFAYGGEMLAAGYPRNDMLYSPHADEISRQVKERLGIPEGKKIVLYAPTWRDDQYYGPGRYKLDLRIDLARFREVLGDEYVLMIRRHPNVVDTVPGAGEGTVWDVSEYPEIAELFLASDVLVTDYSSLMFDYANTGRPMLFFTYDLEHYRDQLRGFYFDFENEAPGPLIATSDELIAALRDLRGTTEQYRGAYKKFQDLFCDLDDGQAAGRVVDRMKQLARES